MKSKAFIFIIAILVVVAVAAYFVVGNKKPAPAATGLVSQTTGASQGLQNQTNASATQTGNQVVTILRNLSVIGLDDAVFKNPAFGYLADISIVLPPSTTPGRRNPFAAIGSDAGAVSPTVQPTATAPAAGN